MLPCRHAIATCTENLSSRLVDPADDRPARALLHFAPIVDPLKAPSIGHHDSLNLNHRKKIRSHCGFRDCQPRFGKSSITSRQWKLADVARSRKLVNTSLDTLRNAGKDGILSLSDKNEANASVDA